MEFPRAAPSGIPQTSLGFRGHLITNFPHIMVLLIISEGGRCPDHSYSQLKAKLDYEGLMSDHGTELRWKGQLGANPNSPCQKKTRDSNARQ